MLLIRILKTNRTKFHRGGTYDDAGSHRHRWTPVEHSGGIEPARIGHGLSLLRVHLEEGNVFVAVATRVGPPRM